MHHLSLIGLTTAFFVYEIDWLAARYGVRKQELESLRQLLEGPREVKRGEILYRSGDRADCVFAIASGSFKSFTIGEEGCEHVANLHFEGDFLGLEALVEAPRNYCVQALTAGRIFRLDSARLKDVTGRVHGLETELLRLMSREVWRGEQHRLLLLRNEASSRLAAFLMYLSDRQRNKGGDPRSLELQMSRRDLAGFLGVASETLSRVLSRLARKKLISVSGRRIRLKRLQEMSQLAGRR